MLPDAELTLQVTTRRQLRVCFLSSSCSLHSSLSSLTQHLPLSPLFVAVRLIVSSRLPSCFLLAAPGCDQRLQLGVHAALQLDSRHHGPQPPHRLQSHPLWVRSAKKKKMGIANTHAPLVWKHLLPESSVLAFCSPAARCFGFPARSRYFAKLCGPDADKLQSCLPNRTQFTQQGCFVSP